ncbi:hypothetical protein [Priestia megaterium]
MATISVETKKSKGGFKKLLEEVCDKTKKQTSFHDAFYLLLTLDNKIPKKQGLESLSYRERVIVDFIGEDHRPIYPNRVSHDYNFTLGVKEYGKLFISEDYLDSSNEIIIGYVSFTAEEYEQIVNKLKQQKNNISLLNEEVEAYFKTLSTENLSKMLNCIYSALYHIDPVIFYIDDETFSYFYKNKNIFKDRGVSHRGVPDVKDSPYILEKLKQIPLHEWSLQEKIFVYNCYWLIQSGNHSRVEEFNGRQLSIQLVTDFIDSKIREYLTELNLEPNSKLILNTIPEKAKYLKRLYKQICENFQFYRCINGLNLNKTEKLLNKEEIQITLGEFPMNIKRYLYNNYLLDGDGFNSVYELFYEWVASTIVKNYTLEEGIKHIEEFIYFYVKEVVRECNGDIAMSRGIRDINKFITLCKEYKYEDICSWSPSEFFCCAVPSDKMTSYFSNNLPLLGNILKAISRRMQYNSWHFTPGNFPIEEVPTERHFFFPPQNPDLAEWSDQHHPGHITASVRYSMRSPEKLVFNNKVYFGTIDLRVVRQKGEPFSLNEFKKLILFTKYLREFYQALSDVIIKSSAKYKIESFDKFYYNDKYNKKEGL